MPRVMDLTESGQSHGGQFKFEGNGRIVDAYTTNNQFQDYAATCGYNFEIQRLDENWNPTNDATVTEHCSAGPVVNEKTGEAQFHPGKATGPDDQSADIGNAGDCGVGDGNNGIPAPRGEVLLVGASGRGPDAKAKISHFTNSAVRVGVKGFASGYAPALIGLEAKFCQMMMEKPAASTAKQPPTCLIIGMGGKPVGTAQELVHQFPTGAGAQAGAGGRVSPPPPSQQGQAAGAAGAGVTPGIFVPVTDPPSGADLDELAHDTAIEMLEVAGAKKPGKTVESARVMSSINTSPEFRALPDYLQPKIKALIKDDQWFEKQVKALGWQVTGMAGKAFSQGSVTIPA